MVEKSFMKHNIKPDHVDISTGTDDSKRESLDASEIAKLKA